MLCSPERAFFVALVLLLAAILVQCAFSYPNDDNETLVAMNPSDIPIERKTNVRMALTMLGAATFNEVKRLRESHNSSAANIRVVFTIYSEDDCIKRGLQVSDCDAKEFTVMNSDTHNFMVVADLASNDDISVHCRGRKEKDVSGRIDYKGRFDVPRFHFDSYQIWYRCGAFRNYNVDGYSNVLTLVMTFVPFIFGILVLAAICCCCSDRVRNDVANWVRGGNNNPANQREQVDSSSGSGRSNETVTTRGTEQIEMEDVSAAIIVQAEREALLTGKAVAEPVEEIAEEPAGEAAGPSTSGQSEQSEAETAEVPAVQPDEAPAVAAEEQPLLEQPDERPARRRSLRRAKKVINN